MSCAVCARPYRAGILVLGEPVCGSCFRWAMTIFRTRPALLSAILRQRPRQ